MMIRQVLTGFFIAMPLSLVCVYFVLVHGDGFPMLVLSFTPFLAVGLYLMTNPAKLGVGLGVSTFITQMAPANVMHVDGAAFLNTGMALIVGLMLAALVFAVLLPEHTMGHKDHIGRALWREALHACTAPARSVKHRFDNRVRDLLSQLNAAAGPAPGVATRAVVRQALTLLEIGHSVIELRELIATARPGATRHALQQCVEHIAGWLRTRSDTALQAALAATQAQVAAGEAAVAAARAQVVGSRSSVDAATATVARIDADITDSVLRATRDGRVQVRVAQPGEVLGAGGRVLSLLDLSDVYMTFFVPSEVAGRIALGSEVRIVLDAAPDLVIPATVSFVASQAQVTPKTVETESERQKLMFRVRAQIAPELLQRHIEQVKTGVPGMAWLRTDPQAQWPASLALDARTNTAAKD